MRTEKLCQGGLIVFEEQLDDEPPFLARFWCRVEASIVVEDVDNRATPCLYGHTYPRHLPQDRQYSLVDVQRSIVPM